MQCYPVRNPKLADLATEPARDLPSSDPSSWATRVSLADPLRDPRDEQILDSEPWLCDSGIFYPRVRHRQLESSHLVVAVGKLWGSQGSEEGDWIFCYFILPLLIQLLTEKVGSQPAVFYVTFSLWPTWQKLSCHPLSFVLHKSTQSSIWTGWVPTRTRMPLFLH